MTFPHVSGSWFPARAVLQYNTSAETLTLSLSGPNLPTSLHVWMTQFGWDGMRQVCCTAFPECVTVYVFHLSPDLCTVTLLLLACESIL